MENQSYFYQFLEPASKELALVARELENSIFTSPRTMLTHARVFVENILQQVMQIEKLVEVPRMSLIDRIDTLHENGLLTVEMRDALHHVRQVGNQAAHDTRRFRYSEALLSWESLYHIVKWYVELYGPVEIEVPHYEDPSPVVTQTYDITEIEQRLKGLEALLLLSMKGKETEQTSPSTLKFTKVAQERPGFTPIRTLTYKNKTLDIPYFLRDAFLLPQRFLKSEIFLIRLGAEQQARIMSELPNNLEELHTYVKRYNEKNDEVFFDELMVFVEEEKVRRQLTQERPGELFFFYKDDHIVVTEQLSQIPLTTEEFSGMPNLLRQLNESGIETVGQLPKELVILAKYASVGVGTVEKLFQQLKVKQGNKSKQEAITT
ncbi:DUF4145 domain-containing protein [Metabacillus iocasae]|uniref:DUF4145 domain-containing protein n=1 Tax=Priestia iocasae TaxID=2291674 RepID=A0ABS2QVZ0_9BACI|nr:DUF4145 domain-containing protein [Metabacillus iocasae]MBM7702916.1 hypothetical protein [Metabacillus iocasae]